MSFVSRKKYEKQKNKQKYIFEIYSYVVGGGNHIVFRR